jgi:hypothetical protein
MLHYSRCIERLHHEAKTRDTVVLIAHSLLLEVAERNCDLSKRMHETANRRQNNWRSVREVGLITTPPHESEMRLAFHTALGRGRRSATYSRRHSWPLASSTHEFSNWKGSEVKDTLWKGLLGSKDSGTILRRELREMARTLP